MTPHLVLVHGQPRHGKSTLEKKLRDEHGFASVVLDHEYVKFIKARFEDLWFPGLGKFIKDHYNHIAMTAVAAAGERPEYRQYATLLGDWDEVVIATIKGVICEKPNVVAEGYLMTNSVRTYFSGAARALGIRLDVVEAVKVADGDYRLRQQGNWITVEKLTS